MNISVIIPIKNRANLIVETLESILTQTLPAFQIIIVDDYSTDGLNEVLLPYKENIVLVMNEGHGPGAARNTGLKYATGDFIQFFDSDDVMSPNKLYEQALVLNADRSRGVVCGPFVQVKQENNEWIQLDVIMQFQPVPAPLYNTVVEGWCSITQSCLFTRELVDLVGPWREDIMTHEDKDYWYRVARVAPYPLHENKSITLYRQHLHQLTDLSTIQEDRTLNGIAVFEDILKYAEKDPVSMKSRWVLKGEIANYKRYYNRIYKKFAVTITDLTLAYFAKAYFKIGRLKTGTDWQPMHGTHADNNTFQKYLALFKKKSVDANQ